MAKIVVNAAYGSVVEDDEDGFLFIGFAEGEDEEEPYVLFRQALSGGPVWFEVNDESLGADDAVAQVALGPEGLIISIAPDSVPKIGWASLVEVRIGPDCEDAAEAIDALRGMLGELFVG